MEYGEEAGLEHSRGRLCHTSLVRTGRSACATRVIEATVPAFYGQLRFRGEPLMIATPVAPTAWIGSCGQQVWGTPCAARLSS